MAERRSLFTFQENKREEMKTNNDVRKTDFVNELKTIHAWTRGKCIDAKLKEWGWTFTHQPERSASFPQTGRVPASRILKISYVEYN